MGSKILAFGAQKTRMQTLKSPRSQNESLVGADFGSEEGEAVTVNGDRYRVMLSEFLFTKIKEEDIGNIFFQQGGATCHTTEAKHDVVGQLGAAI